MHMSAPKKTKWFINQLQDVIQHIGFFKIGLFPRTLDFLMALAKYANKAGHCWPLGSQIENLCGIRKNKQYRHIKILKDKGYIIVKRKYNRREKMTRNYYTINLNAILTISMGIDGDLRVDGIAVNPTSTGSQTSCTQIEPNPMVGVDRNPMVGVATIKTTHTAKQPIRLLDNVQAENRLNDFSAPLDEPIKLTNEIWFEAFWQTYPRKQDKQKARNAWLRNKLDKKIEMINADLIKRMTSDVQWLSGREFIPLPATYLNGERWNDEIIEPQMLATKKEKFNSANYLVDEVRKDYENQRTNEENVFDVSNYLLKKMD